MDSIKLKPCPFCGKSELVRMSVVMHSDRQEYKFLGRVDCLKCFASIITLDFYKTEDEARTKAAESWNRRTE